MKILVLNAGSSTVKFEVVETDAARIRADGDRRLARGLVEGLGSRGRIALTFADGAPVREERPLADHRAAIDRILELLGSRLATGALAGIEAVGHRVVHGGERFREAVLVDDGVIAAIEECADLAPLHNPANLGGIRAVREALGPGLPQVAVFDTAFHATMPEASYLYGLPRTFHQRLRIRRYGFHGTSHRYVADRYRRMTGLARDAVNIITLHLGNGCSACAIRRGASFDTSMGLTPLEGLLMGTRCGDLDPSIIEFLSRRAGLALSEIDSILNRQSGLLGLSGSSGDMRTLLAAEHEEGDAGARLAIDVFCHRVRKYVGAYHAAIGGADAVVFTGGIGENSPEVRSRICEGLDCLGLRLDPARNRRLTGGECGECSTEDSVLRAFVIPTDEELVIARDTYRVVTGQTIEDEPGRPPAKRGDES